MLLDDLQATCRTALDGAEALLTEAQHAVSTRVEATNINSEQFAVHGLSWYATYVEALRQMLGWAERLKKTSRFGALEQLTLQATFGEYLSQLAGGIAMSQVETVRPSDLGIKADTLETAEIALLRHRGNTAAVRQAIADGSYKPDSSRIADKLLNLEG